MAQRHQTTIVALIGLRQLADTGVLSVQGAKHPLFAAAVTMALILTNDLLKEAAAQGQRVTIKDDVCPVGKEQDLTSLIAECRGAACHSNSARHTHGEAILTWNVLCGEVDSTWAGGQQLISEFDDDCAIFFGPMRLYLVRNLLRAIDEARQLFNDEGW